MSRIKRTAGPVAQSEWGPSILFGIRAIRVIRVPLIGDLLQDRFARAYVPAL